MKTTYRFHWRTLSLWRQRTWPQVTDFVSGASWTKMETTCLFSLVNWSGDASTSTH